VIYFTATEDGLVIKPLSCKNLQIHNKFYHGEQNQIKNLNDNKILEIEHITIHHRQN
jgi:hypothetical protein